MSLSQVFETIEQKTALVNQKASEYEQAKADLNNYLKEQFGICEGETVSIPGLAKMVSKVFDVLKSQ